MAGKFFSVGRFIQVLSWTVFLCSAGILAADDQPLRLWQFRETHLAVPVDIRVYAPDEASAKESAQAAYHRIDELNSIFSDYDEESENRRLCRSDQSMKVSPELFFLLTKSLQFSQKSDGAFDVTVGPLIKQWRRARRQKQLPTPQNIASSKALVGSQFLKLEEAEQTVQVLKRGMQLDFGGIAKGYIAEEAFKVLESRGFSRSLVAVAGDIFAGDPPPESEGWKVGVAPLDQPDGPPSQSVRITRQSASTSGDAFQFVEIDGIRYSHIVDPKSGIGLTHRSSVTVIAPEGWLADGLATTVCLLGAEHGLKLLADYKDADALIVYRDDQNQLRSVETPGFSSRKWRE